jgi:drug/metabolite transporter (DMT)-like permease
VAGTVRTRRQSRIPHVSLNSDGQPHPVLNALSVFTLVDGLVSFALGMVLVNVSSAGHGTAVTAAVTGLAALLVGLYAQMMSETREQRILIVTGIIGGFVGLALGLAHGGFGG